MASLGYETDFTRVRGWCLKNGVELIAYDMPRECATRFVMRDPLNRRTVDRLLYGWEPLGQLTEQVLADMLAELLGTEVDGT